MRMRQGGLSVAISVRDRFRGDAAGVVIEVAEVYGGRLYGCYQVRVDGGREDVFGYQECTVDDLTRRVRCQRGAVMSDAELVRLPFAGRC